MSGLTLDSKIKDLLKNPVGVDIIRILVDHVPGVSMDTVKSPLVGNIKLSALPKLSRGMVNEALLSSLIQRLNDYAGEVLPPDRPTVTEKWWKEATVYQIYPRSFCDSNGDGIGDLAGITSKLDYLKDLGIDIIWMSPIYQSPNDDNGYDISDYYAIMREFGTMADFDRLVTEAHERGIKVMMDMVLNHTSDEHAWFKQALADKNSPYRDYYFFRKGKDGGAPNNWTSLFRGPAWIKDEKNDEWYLHLFTKKQCDLNWENQALRKDLYAMMNFWLDMGVDGFRFDVISFIAKAEGLPDGSDVLYEMMGYRGVEHYAYTAKVHRHLAEMHKAVWENRDIVTVGESPGVGLETGKLFTHEDRKELDMLFNFDAIESGGHSRFDEYAYDLNHLKAHHILHQTGNSRGSWNAIFYENHDQPRMVSKISTDPKYRVPVAKMLATLQFALKGTPYIYQGQELGSINNTFSDLSALRDVESLNVYAEQKELGKTEREIMAMLNAGTRDHSRTPMPWDASENAGFTTGTPWIGLNPDYHESNAQKQVLDKSSVFNYYKKMIALKKQERILQYGEFVPYKAHLKDYFGFFRELDGERLFVEINLAKDEKPSQHPKEVTQLLVSSADSTSRNLKPYEGRIYRL